MESDQPGTKVNVTLFDYKPGCRPATTSFTKTKDLRNILDSGDPKAPKLESADALILRLFLVEDPSCQLVELFGSRFNIDPLFFQAHVDYNHDVQCLKAPRLLASRTHRQWSKLQHLRMRDETMGSKSPLEPPKFNVGRDSYTITGQHNWRVEHVTEARTTIWIGRCPIDSGTMVGLVLLDTHFASGQSIYTDQDSCVPTPDLNVPFPQSLPLPTESWFDGIKEMTLRYP
jgi:hypothetical protein